ELAAAMTMEPSTLTRNLRPLVDAGWVTLESGADARSRLVHITQAGRDKRAQAQRSWKAAQLALNDTLGVERVAALHTLIDESLALLAPATEQAHGEN
ncbi:MAG: MarR family transcriptional regulator, partial [Giesbergeria sp.]|nr:MarR family transcriptional regulator [Giesbergeria sp.]